MPNITIYLNEELYEFVKGNASKIIQEALKQELPKRQKKKTKK